MKEEFTEELDALKEDLKAKDEQIANLSKLLSKSGVCLLNLVL